VVAIFFCQHKPLKLACPSWRQKLTVVLLDGGIATVCQGATGAIAKPCYIVLVPAEVLDFGLGLEAAMPVVDDLRR
jgi:hypothetical protein